MQYEGLITPQSPNWFHKSLENQRHKSPYINRNTRE